MKTTNRFSIHFAATQLSAGFLIRTLLYVAVTAQFAAPAHANNFRLGPLIDLSDPDALAACGTTGNEKECSLAVNPANPKNIVAAWIGGSFKGIGTAVTLDGGKKWQQVVIPGLTVCTGGTLGFAVDPWLSFAPNGDLYHVCGAGAGLLGDIIVSKSSDGGLHWNSQVSVDGNTDPRFTLDKPSLTADSTDSHYVYAVWEQAANGNRRFLKFARTTDVGVTWEPARQILDLGNSDQVAGPQILVMPDGTLVCLFLDLLFSNGNGGGQKEEAILAVIRSTDKGQTWSTPIQGPHESIFQATDPDTGFPYVNQNGYPPLFSAAVDSRNGNLYVVFEDTRFSGGLYNDIAFTMSTDGGSTWSAPIPINKTPTNIAPGNRQAFIPTVAVAANGTIGVAYYDFRFNDSNPGLPTDYWLVHCHPSAATPATNPANWGNEVRLTDRSFDMEMAANPSGEAYWVGDYEGLASVGNDFLATWSQPYGVDHDSIFFRRAGP